jgi:anti-anti-sigma regulatory factor
VHGDLGPDSAAEARERIAEVAGSHPGRLVLDLTGLGERYSAECLALVAVTRQLLRPGCALDVRSGNPAVRQILALADRAAAQGGTEDEEPEAV